MTRRIWNAGGMLRGMALWAALLLASPAMADEAMGDDMGKAKASTAPAPVRMDPEKLAGVGLEPSEPFIAADEVLEGTHRPRGSMLFYGDELVMEIYEDEPATFAISEPFPHDEYVLVLSGKLILTDAAGEASSYLPGDSLMVPKGFTGVWKMLGNYRELVSIGRAAYDKAYGTQEE